MNIPLNLLCLVNVYIRPRDMLGPFVVGQERTRESSPRPLSRVCVWLVC